MMTRKPLVFASLLALAGLFSSRSVTAQSSIVHDVADDAKDYFTAPLHWNSRDWLHVGETMIVIGVAHEYDDDMRKHFAGIDPVLDGKDPHSMRDALPAAAVVVGTWAFAALLDDHDGYQEGREMLEAAGFSAVTTTLFKFAGGRRRPNETNRVDDWSNGGDSFPSLHVSAAFAIGGVLAEGGSDRYRWLRRVIGYGMAGATAYGRLHDNVHWLSDTVAGAAIGIASARFVVKRGDEHARHSAFSLLPTDGGLMLTFNTTR